MDDRSRPPRVRSYTLIAAAVLLLTGCASPERTEEHAASAPEGPASADPAALAAADSTLAALGGWDAWERARYFTFDYVAYRGAEELGRRSHRWDRFRDRHRVSGTTPEGAVFIVFREGTEDSSRVFLEDAEITADSARAEWLERAQGQLVNDFYWLAMPWKIHDPGVHLAERGARTDTTGKTWRVIQLSFDEGVGLTPGDRYWVYLDPETYLPGRWDYLLEDMDPDGPPRTTSWVDWQEVGPILLSLERHVAHSDVSLRFENVAVSETVPEGAFRPNGS